MFSKKEKKSDQKKMDPRKRALLFLGFYLIFFIVIISLIRTSPPTSEKDNATTTTKLPSYKLDSLLAENYHFRYTLTEDAVLTTYEGDKRKEKERFTVTTVLSTSDFFNNNGTILEKNATWILASESPYRYPEFLDIKEINRLIKNSTYLSKTEFSNNEKVYNYQISTTSLLDLLKQETVDLDDKPNTITLYLKGEEVYKVSLDISSYAHYFDNTKQQVTYVLEYSNFGKIAEVTQD